MVDSGCDMACYDPIPASRSGRSRRFVDGTWVELPPQVVLHPKRDQVNLRLPCGRCLGCKSDRAAAWAARIRHETRKHDHNVFVTLTYDPEHEPPGGDLEPGHLQDFWKRLRSRLARGAPGLVGDRLRYFACGEYGDRFGRPHYHAICFGLGVRDGYLVGDATYASPTLREIWGQGNITFGEVTPARAAYVAQYTLKKLGATHCDSDGVVKTAPFVRCSLKPGIGRDWLDAYRKDLTNGYLVQGGQKLRIPRYYRTKLAETDAPLAAEIEDRSEEYRANSNARFDPERLKAAAIIHQRRIEQARKRVL